MKDDAFFVPVLERSKDNTLDCSLYHVHAGNAEGSHIIGVQAFDDDLADCFKNLSFEEPLTASVSILQFPGKKPLTSLTENERSVFLGIFLQISRLHLHLDYIEYWDSITVTGDLYPHNGRTELKAVTDIEKKYRGILDYAGDNPEQKHLFLYITNSDSPLGLEERANIEIKAFRPKNSLFELFYFIFGPTPLEIDENRLDGRQRTAVKNISGFQYIRPKGFYAMEEMACSRFYKGSFIYGEGDTGKSALAMALSALLLNRRMIYAPLWIWVSGRLYDRKTDSLFRDGTGDDCLEDYNDSEEQYLISKIGLAIDGAGVSASALGNKRYAVILDNLEFPPDKIKRLLNALKNVIASRFRLAPYVIVTSRSACDEELLENFGITLEKAPEFGVDSLAPYIDSLVRGKEYNDKIEQGRQSAEYRALLEELHAHYRWYPGVIKTMISLLRNEEIKDVLVIAKQLGTGQDAIKDKQEEMFYKAFSYLDKDAQNLLFTLMGTGGPGSNSERDKLFDIIFNRPEYQKNEETRKLLGKALGNLLDSNFVYREQNTSCYGIKTLPYLLFMFNRNFAGLEIEPGLSLRDRILSPSWRFFIALEYDQPAAEVKKLLERYSNEELLLDDDSFILAVKNSSISDKLDLLLDRDCNINYIDENQLNSLMMAAVDNPNTAIIEWLFEHKVDISHKYLDSNAFHLAAAHTSNPAILESMLKHGFKTTDPGENGALPLGMAARWNGNTAILDFFASQSDFDINIKMRVHVNVKKILKMIEDYIDEEEYEKKGTYFPRVLKLASKFINKIDGYIMPIHLAAHNPNVEILRWFLDHGARTEQLPDGSTLLSTITLVQANPAFLDLLNEHGYDITEKGITGACALHCAAMTNGSIPVFEWLKNHGLDINAPDDDGDTPLSYAATFNPDLEIVNWFTANGAVIDIEGSAGNINNYFEESLICNKNPAVFQWFLDQDAYINAVDSDGDTILHVVAQSECPAENIIWMLDHDADPNLCNNEGLAAMEYLRERKDWNKLKKHIR
jgi:ankyrin repeat protein